jgi:RimJ/RimL family protein N-acetyltransferase
MATTRTALFTPRLRLVPLSDAHLDNEVELDSDPAVVRFIGNGKPRSREQVEELHPARIARGAVVPGLCFWAGFLRSELRSGSNSSPGGEHAEPFVGIWILTPPRDEGQDPTVFQAELGYRLMRKFWRQGLAKEGTKELLRYEFHDLGLRRIYAETMAVNAASRATMLSVGMKFERRFRQEFEEMIPGSEEGEVEYSITSEEWKTLILKRGP